MSDLSQMTQCEQVIWYMQRYGSITGDEAKSDLGIERLAARIWDLQNKFGYQVKSETVKGKNRFGKKTRFSRYSLEE